MKRTTLLALLIGGFAYITLSSNAGGESTNRTGSDGSGPGCAGTGCHNSTATPGIAVTVLLDSAGTAVSHYVAGMSYRVRLTGVNATTATLPNFGYQLSVFKGSAGSGATQAGTLSDLPASSMLNTFGALSVLGSTAAIASSGTGTTGSQDTISVGWTAPVTGTGTVRMYAVLCAGNGDAGAGVEDVWNTAINTFTEEAAPSGISDVTLQNELAVYPVPFNDHFRIATGRPATDARVILYDLSGRLVKSISFDGKSGNDLFVDATDCPAGIYTLVLTLGPDVAVRQLVKQ